MGCTTTNPTPYARLPEPGRSTGDAEPSGGRHHDGRRRSLARSAELGHRDVQRHRHLPGRRADERSRLRRAIGCCTSRRSSTQPVHISGTPTVNVRHRLQQAGGQPVDHARATAVERRFNVHIRARRGRRRASSPAAGRIPRTTATSSARRRRSPRVSSSTCPSRSSLTTRSSQPDSQIGLVIHSSDPEFTIRPAPGRS